MLNFHKFVILSAISVSSVCYSMESKNILNNENDKCSSNKQLIDSSRSKKFNNYPEKKLFFNNNINENKSNINDNKNNNKSNNEINDFCWNIIKEVIDENNNLKSKINYLEEENDKLKIQNKQQQQQNIELKELVSELQKQIKNNNVEQIQDNMQCNDCDSNTIVSTYTQYVNLQEYNSSLLNSIDDITNQLQLLEAENAIKDKIIRYRDWKIGCKDNKIKYLQNQNKRLSSSLRLVRSRSNSVIANNNKYNNLSSYSNYKSYRNINYNNKYNNNTKSYSTQKESKTYNQLLAQQIKDLEQGNNQNLNNNQSKNKKLEYQINNNQNSAIDIINNINNNKKHIIQSEEEANQIFGNGVVCKSNIQNTQNIIGLSEDKLKNKLKNRLKNKKNRKNKKYKKENNNVNNNNINIINAEDSSIKEEKQFINTINKEESIENDNINNEEYKKEDIKYENKIENIKEDKKVYDNDKEDEKVDYEQEDLNNFNEIKNDLNNINILKNGLTGNNNLNNNISLSDNGKNIKDDLTVIPEQDDNFTVITDYNENKNKLKKLKRREAKNRKDEEFYKAFENYSDDIKKDNEETEKISKELELKKQQIIHIGEYDLNIEILKNTDEKYSKVLETNIGILKNFSEINRIINNDINIKAYSLFTVYKLIELQKYNDILRENNLKNSYLLNFKKGNEIIKGIIKVDYIKINSLMSKELYYNVLNKDLFVKNGIKWPKKYMKTVQNILKQAKGVLTQFFFPILSYGLNIETMDKHIDNTLSDTNKRYSLMKYYLRFFLNDIKGKNKFIKTLDNKKIVSDFNKVVNVFKNHLLEIINIIKNNEFNKCIVLIDELSNKVENELLSQYWSFYDLYNLSYNVNPGEEIKEESLIDCVDFVNKVKDNSMIKELIDTISA